MIPYRFNPLGINYNTYGSWNNWGLPSGYQACEYLEATGTQYIDTGVAALSDDELQVIASCNISSITLMWVCGSRNNLTSGAFVTTMGNTYARIDIFATGNQTVVDQDTSQATLFTIKDKCGRVNDTLITDRSGTNSTLSPYSIWLFSCNQNSVTMSYNLRGKIYSYQHKRDNITLSNLQPAIDRDGTPCMYDRVSKTPLYNQGTGNFSYALK